MIGCVLADEGLSYDQIVDRMANLRKGAATNAVVTRSERGIPFLEVAMWTPESRALVGDVGAGAHDQSHGSGAAAALQPRLPRCDPELVTVCYKRLSRTS